MSPERFSRIAKALADPQRFAILERIAAGESPTGEVSCRCLVDSFPVTQATISHHLKELTNAGLIDCRREGKCNHLRLRRDVLDAYRAELDRRLGSGVVAKD